MKTINPEWIRQIQSADNPYFDLQQMAILDLGWGTARLEISLDRRHLQPFGVVHGGVCASLLDAAGFWAVFSKVDPEAGMTTIELKINYLSPVVGGRLIGLGSCIKLGRSLGLGEARIENEDGRLLAHGTTTVMIQPGMKLPEPIRQVPKYLD
ncbi:MAG: PaaI family thioesterase [Desulfohalobiaceae bacterium]|nr:PaaI family thioesterase [Desulfohalobiaceae bacterium]